MLERGKKLGAVCDEVGKRMVGHAGVLRLAVGTFVAGGHILFEDVPGTGKTTLAVTLAQALGLRFARVQGTPDLLPAELLGTMVFDPRSAEFSFRPGPIFTQVLLVDEINRATPRTQSALLEAMAEGQVTVDGQTRRLESPFLVLASANPIESQGVFPLPEAQLDRFLTQLRLGYLSEDEELAMIGRIRLGEPEQVFPVMSPEELLAAREAARAVTTAPDLLRYIVRLCRATRDHERVALGASPRAEIGLTALAQALALIEGRAYVLPDDVKTAWFPVMRHRVRTHVDWQGAPDEDEVGEVLKAVLEQTPVPAELAAGA